MEAVNAVLNISLSFLQHLAGQGRKRTGKLCAAIQVPLVILSVRDLKNGSYLVLEQLLLVRFSQGEHTRPSKTPYGAVGCAFWPISALARTYNIAPRTGF